MNSHSLIMIVMAALCATAALAARPLVMLNIGVYEAFGFKAFARFWEAQTRWWIPTVRVLYTAGAVAFLLVAVWHYAHEHGGVRIARWRGETL